MKRVHRPFALVFGGGGARGFAHLGVLRALERDGYHPERIVGVSMGAPVGVTYASRLDWYDAVLAISIRDFPGPTAVSTSERSSPFRRLAHSLRVFGRPLHSCKVGARQATRVMRGWRNYVRSSGTQRSTKHAFQSW